MTQALENVIAMIRRQPEADREALAALMLQEMESDRRWDELFARPESQTLLERMADQAIAEIKAGRSRRLGRGKG